MPNALLELDTMYPQLDGKSDRERITAIGGYLYHMRELLTYLFHNLGRENFNETSFGEMADVINAPISAMIEDAEGKIAQLSLTAEGLSSQITDVESGLSSRITQTADSLTTQITNVETGLTSQITQTEESLTTKISDNTGRITSLTQTVDGLTSRVSDAEGNITTLSQAADSLTARVSSAEGYAASAYMTANSISLGVTDGVNGPSITLYKNGSSAGGGSIDLSGMVSFSDLSGVGMTLINGANIWTGTLSAGKIAADASGYIEFTAPISTSYVMTNYGMYLGDEVTMIGVEDSPINGRRGISIAAAGGVRFYNGAYTVIGNAAYPFITEYDLRMYGLIP